MLVSSRRFAYVRSHFVLPVLPVLQIRQARSILRHANTGHKHKPAGRRVFVLCARLPDSFKRKTLDNVQLYVFVFIRFIDKTAAVLLYLLILLCKHRTQTQEWVRRFFPTFPFVLLVMFCIR